eukprot:2189029-Alexandrium_andersonii.AAC.1
MFLEGEGSNTVNDKYTYCTVDTFFDGTTSERNNKQQTTPAPPKTTTQASSSSLPPAPVFPKHMLQTPPLPCDRGGIKRHAQSVAEVMDNSDGGRVFSIERAKT